MAFSYFFLGIVNYMISSQRIVLLDCDMIVMRNMDELFDIDLPDGWIAASHACACNPMKFAHYPTDWWASFLKILAS